MDQWRKIVRNALNILFFSVVSELQEFTTRISFWFILAITKSQTNPVWDCCIIRKFNLGWNVQVCSASLLLVGLTYHLELNLWRLMEICQGAAPALLPLGDAVFIKVILLALILENVRKKRCLPGKFGIERSSAIVKEWKFFLLFIFLCALWADL